MEYDKGKRGYSMLEKRKHYDSIDGLRVLACLGIVTYHVNTNIGFSFGNQYYQNFISHAGTLVKFFLMVSAFSLCCGYYERIQNNVLRMEDFYEKRIAKIWPFFGLAVLLDTAAGHDLPSLMEGFANLTLLFGLLPNSEFSVIGVGWFIGTVFVFYIFFPFYCVLLKTKKRAWFVMLVAMIYHICCSTYFFNTDHVVESYYRNTNFLYMFMFLVAGGLIYLYREELERFFKDKRVYILLCVIILGILRFTIKPFHSELMRNFEALVLCCLCLIYGICSNGRLLNNKLMKFLSGISMEIYICHMMIFRIVVKLHLSTLCGKNVLSYILDCIMVIAGAIIFSMVGNKFIEWIQTRVNKVSKGKESK